MAIPKGGKALLAVVLAVVAAAVISCSAGAHVSPLTGQQFAAGCYIVLFPSVLGLRPAVLEWAEWLRREGHRVVTPDFFDGRTFSTYEEADEGLQAAGGIARYMEWTAEIGQGVPPSAVFMGFSNGAGSAELLAATSPNAKAAVLMHGALPLERLGVTEWPRGVPVQAHFAENDPYRIPAAVEALEAGVQGAGAQFEYFSYAGAGHLFADRDLPEFDRDAAALMADRVGKFLQRVCVEETGRN